MPDEQRGHEEYAAGALLATVIPQARQALASALQKEGRWIEFLRPTGV